MKNWFFTLVPYVLLFGSLLLAVYFTLQVARNLPSPSDKLIHMHEKVIDLDTVVVAGELSWNVAGEIWSTRSSIRFVEKETGDIIEVRGNFHIRKSKIVTKTNE